MSPRNSWRLGLCALLALCSAVTWAAQAAIDAATRGTTSPWQGVLSASQPLSMQDGIRVEVASSGAVVFRTDTGVSGTGHLSLADRHVRGIFEARHPFSMQFSFDGELTDGVVHGRYSGNVESGSFTLCDARSLPSHPDCHASQESSALTRAVGGILSIFQP